MSNLNGKQIAAVSVVAVILVAVCAVALYDRDAEGDGTRSWNHSSLVGNLPDEVPDAVDDFYTYVNYDWISENQDIESVTLPFYTLQEYVYEQFDLLDGSGDPGYELYLEITEAYLDTDLRDEIGTDELMEYVNGLIHAESLDDLTDYLVGGYCVLTYPMFEVEVFAYKMYSDEYVAYIIPYVPTTNDEYFGSLLSLIGYSDEEVESMNAAANALVAELEVSYTEEELYYTYSVYTQEELAESSANFPIVEILVGMGYDCEEYWISDTSWLETMNSIYVEENFEGLRAILLRDSLATASQFLYGEFLEAYLEHSGYDIYEAWDEYIWSESALMALMSTIYSNNFSNPEAAEATEDLFVQLKDAFRERIGDAEWMDDETRTYALEKLDAMEIRFGGGDVIDFSGLVLPSTEGGGPLADYVAIKSYYDGYKASQVGTVYDQSDATSILQSYVVNAGYITMSNCVYVPWAMLQDGFIYNSDSSTEELLGTLGMIIGHEITHGFDTTGSQYAADGSYYDWWSEESAAAFEERTDALAEYISEIVLTPDRTMDVDIVIGEVIADMGSIALALDIAAGIEGFDYEEYFTAFADLWKGVYTEAFDAYMQLVNYHPPYQARVNMAVQQFQIFHDTFGVSEGDGMYLAPEDRVAVW